MRRHTATLAVAAMLLAGCGSSTTMGPTPGPTPVNGGTLTIGVWQTPSSFLAARVIASQPFSRLIDAPVAEGLLWYADPSNTKPASPANYYQPWLATEIPTTANGDVKTSGCPNLQARMCVTWKLRSNVSWDDGSALSAKDVCDTYQLYWLTYGAKNPTPVHDTAGWSSAIDCQATDTLTAIVDYNAVFASYLSLGTGVMGILPASQLEPALQSGQNIEAYKPNVDLSLGTNNPDAYAGSELTMDQMLDGTGPYVFKSADSSDIILVKNNNYWNRAHLPHIARLIFKLEPSISAEFRDAQDGAIDMAFDLGANNYDSLSTIASGRHTTIKVQAVAEPGVEKLDLNLCGDDVSPGGGSSPCGAQASSSAYTKDPVIRKAILEAVNRQNLANEENGDQAGVPPDSYLTLGAGWAGTVTSTLYSPTKARSMLNDAHYLTSPACGTDTSGDAFRAYSDGTCIAINLGVASDDTVALNVATHLVADLARVGIKVIVPLSPSLPGAGFFAPYSAGGPLYTHKFDMAISSDMQNAPGEPDSFRTEYHGDCGGSCPASDGIASPSNVQGVNDTGIDDSALDSALDLGHMQLVPRGRASAYGAAQRELARALPTIPLFQIVTLNTYPAKLEGFRPNAFAWDYNVGDWFCINGSCQA